MSNCRVQRVVIATESDTWIKHKNYNKSLLEL